MPKKIVKTTAWIIGGLLLIIALALLFIQLPFGKRMVSKIAENQANKILTASLSVGKISGNYFTHLELIDLLLLTEDGDTVAYIPAIRLAYKLTPLLDKKIEIEKIDIDNPCLFLKQYVDSTWNFQHLVKSTPEDTTTTSFDWLISLGQLSLSNAAISICAKDSVMPSIISDLNLVISGLYDAGEYSGEVEQFSFKAQAPDVALNKLALKVNGNMEKIEISAFTLQTAQNQIDLEGLLYFDLQEKSFVNLRTKPIVLDEFAWILPDVSTKARPQLSLSFSMAKSRIDGEIQITEYGNGLFLQFNSDKLLDALLADSAQIIIPGYDIKLQMNNIDAAYWLDNPEMGYVINGNLMAKGSGISPENIDAKLQLHLFNSEMMDCKFENIDLDAYYNRGDIDASLFGSGDFGEITLLPKVTDLLGKRPHYQLAAETRNFNPAILLNDKNFEGNVNLMLQAVGSGFDYKTLQAVADLQVTPSHLFGLVIDSIQTDIDYAKRNVTVNELVVKALDARITANGNYSLVGQSDLKLYARIDSLDKLKSFLNIDVLDGLSSSLLFDGHLSGAPDSLYADMILRAGHTRFEDYHLDSLDVNAIASLVKNKVNIDGDVRARSITAAGFTFDTLLVDLSTDLTNYTADLELLGKEINLNLCGSAKLADTISAVIPSLGFSYYDYSWVKQDDSTTISLTSTRYAIDKFKLFNAEDRKQSIEIGGVVDRNGEQDFKVVIEQLNIPEVLKLAGMQQNITGNLNANLSMTGEARNPEIQGYIYVDSAAFEEYRIDSLNGRVYYRDEQLQALFSLVPEDSGKVYIAGEMPAHIALDSLQFEVVPQDEDSVSVMAFITDLPLAIVRMLLPIDQADGKISSRVELAGTFGDPQINGFLRIPDGSFRSDLYGINYQNINVNINIETDKASIDTLYIESFDKHLLSRRVGMMNAKGEVLFNKSLMSGELTEANITIDFDKFRPINHKQYNAELDGDITLHSESDSVYFSGNITIPETQVYLPALMALFGETGTPSLSKPLLVRELEKNKIDSSAVVTVSPIKTESDTIAPATRDLSFMDNLHGDIKVIIPRNMWIKNDDMRIELSGDVDLIKHHSFFEIFGNIDIVRGQYVLMNKTFLIKSGSVVFQGGEELNPLLNLEASYIFRDPERNKKELKLNISGDLNKPELAFSVDGANISEGDAVSYVLFGMSMDALTSNQSQTLSSGMDAVGLAQSAASSLVSSELTKVFGKLLNVDYIELKSNGSFKDMSLNIGKYITNNIFLSYEQHIGATEDENASNTTFRLEYEIFKFLFLELTASSNWKESGGDVIFKFNSK
ncbi:translocation/assembly module TamB domain-containing protein [Bacteroidales bacterium OttesenSCG-928-A14]|nr:translocation/assembly module TamB domain-containing protein [Bacteroidales bacterium OttesenSCG-928-A14]